MLEKDIENLIAQNPDEFFPKSGFKLFGQQVKLGRCFADIIFEDKFQRKIIVEVKKGILSRDASGQIMEYYGLLKNQSSTDIIELILCANVIPKERKTFLETVGIECKEVGISLINQIAQKVGYKFIDNQKLQNKKFRIPTSLNTDDIWIFQANPKKYDFFKMTEDKEVIKEFHWRVKQHKNEIRKGQIGLIWLSGTIKSINSGIYAIVEILSNPDYFEESEAEKIYWHDNSEEEGKQLRVKMRLIKDLTNNPILKETLKNEDGLQNLSIIKMPRPTNSRVTKEEWTIIKKQIEN